MTGAAGDGGPATAALLHLSGALLAADGTLFVTDVSESRIRKVTPAGVISTIAGTGVAGDAGDGGPATAAELQPTQLALTVRGTCSRFRGERRPARSTTAPGSSRPWWDRHGRDERRRRPGFGRADHPGCDRGRRERPLFIAASFIAGTRGIRVVDSAGTIRAVSDLVSNAIAIDPAGALVSATSDQIMRLAPGAFGDTPSLAAGQRA